MSTLHIALVLSPAVAALFAPDLVRKIARRCPPRRAGGVRGARPQFRRCPRSLTPPEWIAEGMKAAREGWESGGSVRKW